MNSYFGWPRSYFCFQENFFLFLETNLSDYIPIHSSAFHANFKMHLSSHKKRSQCTQSFLAWNPNSKQIGEPLYELDLLGEFQSTVMKLGPLRNHNGRAGQNQNHQAMSMQSLSHNSSQRVLPVFSTFKQCCTYHRFCI